MNILATICAAKRLEVARQQEQQPLPYLKQQIGRRQQRGSSLRQALLASPHGVIAEFKRRSPSKGWISPDADVEAVVSGYEQAGAAAISCLTDEPFFGGAFADFEKARRCLTRAPLLRKEFILDEYQLYQSKAMGADAILLIAACLTPAAAAQLAETAHALELEVLLEIHSERELDYLQPHVDVVGINNRSLKTFATDVERTVALAHKIPEGYVKISESGLSQPQTVAALRREGFRGFLMGEHFMKTGNPPAALAEFCRAVTSLL